MNSSGRIRRQRADRVRDALAPDDRFGFDRDAMAAGELARAAAAALVVRRRASRGLRGDRRARSRSAARSSAREKSRVVRRARRPRDHQPAAAVLRHVAAFADADVRARPARRRAARAADRRGRADPAARAARLRPRARSASARRVGDRLPHAVGAEARQRLVERRRRGTAAAGDRPASRSRACGRRCRCRRARFPARCAAHRPTRRSRSSYSEIEWPSGAVKTTYSWSRLPKLREEGAERRDRRGRRGAAAAARRCRTTDGAHPVERDEHERRSSRRRRRPCGGDATNGRWRTTSGRHEGLVCYIPPVVDERPAAASRCPRTNASVSARSSASSRSAWNTSRRRSRRAATA